MESSVPRVRRQFLSWDGPFLPQAVDCLTSGWQGDGPLDLSTLLVLVPTRQAGRRLREALAVHAAARGQAVFPPRVLLPEGLFDPGPQMGAVASRLEARLAWMDVLLAISLEDFREVFPVDPPAQNAAWAQQLAREFLRLQRSLMDSGLRLNSVLARAGNDFPEAERWRQLGRMEDLYIEALAKRGLRDPQGAWLEAGGSATWAEGITRIVLLGLPDPVPLALSALEAPAVKCLVDVVVFAPPGEADAFDEWGRPREEAWGQRVLDLPDFAARVHLCADPMEQAGRIVRVAESYAAPEGMLAVGSADPEVLSVLEQELVRAGVPAFNPEGRRRSGDGLYQLLMALAKLAADESFSTVAGLVRCPDFLECLSARLGASFSAARLLAELDEIHSEHLPATLTDARRHRPGLPAFDVIAEIRTALTRGSFAASAAEVLGGIFAARRFDLSRSADALAAESAAAWMEIVKECARSAETFATLTLKRAEWWDLAFGLYAEAMRYDEKPAGALELQGWLELLWEDAPHLVVAGVNEGLVPDAIAGDPFLPESLRRRLGLKTNGHRFARDAYLLQALAHSRAQTGRLDLLFGRTSSVGDPMRPSRLLLRCTDTELPQRVSLLFRPVEAGRVNPSWRRAWQLTPRRQPPPSRVAVTALRAWLACPFRFYLKHGLRMGAVDPAKTELNAMDFGTLCHAALEAMGREPGLRDCTDPALLREFLLAALEVEATRRFGRELTLPLVVQLESARQRLSRAAVVQADTRRAGWVIEKVEETFLIDVGGLAVSGKIDRIDRNESSGEYRVIDYKTTDRPHSPPDAHFRSPRRGEVAREFACVDVDGRPRIWKDLQLPLYLRAVGGATGCGYFNLPKATGDTGIQVWSEYTAELDAAAWRCAEGVAAAIRAGEFWPPGEGVRDDQDEFGSCFHHGAAESVRWAAGEEAAP